MGYRPLRFSRITNPFGAPGGYASRENQWGPAGHHTGIDFGRDLLFPTLRGAKVRSSLPGVVTISEYNSWAGNMVGVYNASQNVLLTYWHLSSRKVKVGDEIEFGEFLGRVGSTGNSTAPHLHVQANRGPMFDYHGHIPPGPWVRGEDWARPARKQKVKR